MPTITFLETGDVYEVPAGTSYLEFCQASGAPQMFGCTVGSCGTCSIGIAAGADNLPPVTDSERDTLDMVTHDPDARLGCQLVVNGDISIRRASDRGHGGRHTGR